MNNNFLTRKSTDAYVIIKSLQFSFEFTELKGEAKECKSVKVDDGGSFFLRVNCSSLKLSSLPALDIPNVAKLL